MRVVSLVPSWTETLLEVGVNVVGRTRFCIHPHTRVTAIPTVGGTKDWDLAKIVDLKPDLIVLDQEENPKSMSEEAPADWVATQVASTADMPRELEALSRRLKAPQLLDLGERWKSATGLVPTWRPGEELPGVLEWGPRPGPALKTIVYMIWKKPWMAVSKETFISSMLGHCGLTPYLPEFKVKYPQVELSDFDPKTTLLLFSSEPFPFLKIKSEIPLFWSGSYAIVNGEAFSWFGVRSLRFLESLRSNA